MGNLGISHITGNIMRKNTVQFNWNCFTGDGNVTQLFPLSIWPACTLANQNKNPLQEFLHDSNICQMCDMCIYLFIIIQNRTKKHSNPYDKNFVVQGLVVQN